MKRRWQIHTWSIVQPLRRMKLCYLKENRWNGDDHVKKNQMQKDKYHIFSHMWNLERGKGLT
jgi:hypothetical protein